MRQYAKLHPPTNPSEIAKKILSREITHTIDFTLNEKFKKSIVSGFCLPPEANWGPKRRAGRLDDDLNDTKLKKNKNQPNDSKE